MRREVLALFRHLKPRESTRLHDHATRSISLRRSGRSSLFQAAGLSRLLSPFSLDTLRKKLGLLSGLLEEGILLAVVLTRCSNKFCAVFNLYVTCHCSLPSANIFRLTHPLHSWVAALWLLSLILGRLISGETISNSHGSHAWSTRIEASCHVLELVHLLLDPLEFLFRFWCLARNSKELNIKSGCNRLYFHQFSLSCWVITRG